MNITNNITPRITPVNNLNNRKINNQKHNSNVNFTSNKSDAVLQLLDKSIEELISESGSNLRNKIRFNRILNEAIPYIIQPKNYINAGRESKVYRINDKYVAKIRRGFYENDTVSILRGIFVIDKKYAELDAYYGEPLVRNGQIEILKNATPDQNNIACGTSFLHDFVRTKDIQKYETEFIPTCNSIPQESYDQLATNLRRINQLKGMSITGPVYYTPDVINPNNIIISGNKFKIVDKLEEVKVENPNSLFTMLEPLLLKLNPEQPTMYKESLVEPRKNIFKKCMISAEKVGLPLNSEQKWEFSDFTLIDILGDSYPFNKLAKMRGEKAPLAERLAFIENSVNGMTNKLKD